MGSKIILQKELAKMLRNPPSDLFVVRGLIDDNIQRWEIYIVGPPNTCYENGIYKAELTFPDDYPIRPPTLRFKSKLHHPNIYLDGKVCISTLQVGQNGKDFGQYWRPVLGIEQAVLSVISLFDDPNIEDPANSAAANQYKKDKKAYEQRCRNLAVESLKHLPKDFEHPSEIYKRLKKAREAKKREEEEKAARQAEDEVYIDEESWEYDIEDIYEDESDESDEDSDEDGDEVHMCSSDDEEEEQEDEAFVEIDADEDKDKYLQLRDNYEEFDSAESLFNIETHDGQGRRRSKIFSSVVRAVSRKKSRENESLQRKSRNSDQQNNVEAANETKVYGLAKFFSWLVSTSKRLRMRS